MTISEQQAKPVVSVAIPTYQGAGFIGAAIESVLMQSFKEFELIIIDDNSTDGTASIAGRYTDPRIRFMRNDHNLGPERNWNRCLTEARGRYFKLLPQDDLLAPDCLQRQVAVFEADTEESIALVFSARTIINANGRAIMTRGYPLRRGGRIDGRSALQTCLRRGTNLIGEPGAVLFRKSLADQVGGFDAGIGYLLDLDYWFRLLLRGDAYYLPEILASFRVSGRSWSVAIGAGQSEDFRRFITRISEQPEYGTGAVERLAGSVMARLHNLLRICLYKFLHVGR